jgi:glutamate racemase
MYTPENMKKKEAIEMNDGLKIGVIDSGVGGLTVLKQLIKAFPFASFIYIGDTKNCPYGNKEIPVIKQALDPILEYVVKRKMDLLVVACNTATALFIEQWKYSLPMPVVGVIEPGVEMALNVSVSKRIGILATSRTIESGVYEKEIKKREKNAFVVNHAAPLLVPMIERGKFEEREEAVIQSSLSPFEGKGIDTLVLGCTHYPLICESISRYIGEEVRVVDPAVETVKKVQGVINETKKNQKEEAGCHEFYATGESETLKEIAKNWLDLDINVKKLPVSVQKKGPQNETINYCCHGC